MTFAHLMFWASSTPRHTKIVFHNFRCEKALDLSPAASGGFCFRKTIPKTHIFVEIAKICFVNVFQCFPMTCHGLPLFFAAQKLGICLRRPPATFGLASRHFSQTSLPSDMTRCPPSHSQLGQSKPNLLCSSFPSKVFRSMFPLKFFR